VLEVDLPLRDWFGLDDIAGDVLLKSISHTELDCGRGLTAELVLCHRDDGKRQDEKKLERGREVWEKRRKRVVHRNILSKLICGLC
jgi:hypothetical protein